MFLSTHHLITFLLSLLAAVAIGVVFQERRRRRGLIELTRRFLDRRFRRNAEEPPF